MIGAYSYLLLVLRKSLVLLEELRDVGLVGHFEHGDSLDGHFGGIDVQVAIGDLWTCNRRILCMD